MSSPSRVQRPTGEADTPRSESESAIGVRLDAMDKAVNLLQDNTNKSPTVGEVVAEFREKFNSVQAQFTNLKELSDKLASTNKLAIDAALQAAKEAVGEQNKTFSKQIDSMTEIVKTSNGALSSQISDLKDRINVVDNRAQTNVTRIDSSSEGHDKGISSVNAVMLGALSFLSFVVAVAAVLFEVAKR